MLKPEEDLIATTVNLEFLNLLIIQFWCSVPRNGILLNRKPRMGLGREGKKERERARERERERERETDREREIICFIQTLGNIASSIKIG
jgi:hypothetical protein